MDPLRLVVRGNEMRVEARSVERAELLVENPRVERGVDRG
jgi:hypothetical protein